MPTLTVLGQDMPAFAIAVASLSGLTSSRGDVSNIFTAEYSGTANQATRDSISRALRDVGATDIEWSEGTIAELRQVLVKRVKAHREQKLENRVTFEYPAASGNLFSCSQKSKSNWSALAALDSRSLVSWPYSVTTQDEVTSYSVTNAADLDGVLAAMLTAIETERATAKVKIDAILAGDETAARAAADAYLAT